MLLKPLNRRAMLRGLVGGAAASIALPPLEAMLHTNGRALADGTDLPTRFGVWFWGNGTKPEWWIPTTTGANWSPNYEMASLTDLRPYLSVLSGMEIKTATHPHHSGMTGVLSGAAYYQLGTTRDTIVSTFARQSVDQVAADWFAGTTPYRSLELGITRFRGSDEGTTFEHLSHNGPSSPNPSEYEPINVYRRLFGVDNSARLDLVRRSVLDTVGDQVTRLHARIGATDKARLDQHLSSIRDLETRLGTEAGACTIPAEPGSYPDQNGQEPIAERNLIMSQLLSLALACDLTRAFSVQFSTCGSGVIIWEVGAPDGLHSMFHVETSPFSITHAAVTFEMEQFGVFLRTLRDTPEGDGNLLDRCSILATTELTDGYTHSNYDFPIMIAGLGGGRLAGNQHYRSGSAENTSLATLTALRGAGCDVPYFGDGAGYVTSTIGAVEA